MILNQDERNSGQTKEHPGEVGNGRTMKIKGE